MPQSSTLADRVLGLCGMAVIVVALRLARLRAWLTRAPWRDD